MTSDTSVARYDVLAIGNAIVDIIGQSDEALLHREGIAKGGMALIDEARASHLYAVMGPTTVTSGGSAANTIVGIASFGGRCAYIGKVKADSLGDQFGHDIRASKSRLRHTRRI